MIKLIYEIDTQDLIDELEDMKYVKIELYSDESYEIMNSNAYGYSENRINIQYFEIYDYEDCNCNIDEFKEWLNDCWIGGIEVENEKFEGKIYLKFK